MFVILCTYMICIIDGCLRETCVFDQIRRGKPTQVKYKWCIDHWTDRILGNRKRDRYIAKAGYVIVKTSRGKWKAEHRIIMEEELGRKLRKNESVHHINGIRNDNRLLNLELWVGNIISGQRAADLTCPHCKLPYYKPV